MSEVGVLNVVEENCERQVRLSCDVAAGEVGGVAGWTQRVDQQLRFGSAAAVRLGSGGPLDTVVAVVVGAWTSERPCCGTEGPAADDLCSWEGTLRIEVCGDCGATVSPDVWAVMPIVPAGADVWLPEPHAVARLADGSLRSWQRRYRSQARREALRAAAAQSTEGGLRMLAADGVGPTLFAARLLWNPAGGRQMFQPALRVDPAHRRRLAVGWCEPVPAKGAAVWESRFCCAAEMAAGPTELLGLMDPASRSRLLDDARAGRLDAARLRSGWKRIVDEPAGWVCDGAAAAEICEQVRGVGRTSPDPARLPTAGLSR